ncbi:MAG: shikimate kinase AroK [Gammaproteobacteria bacterium]|nr:shikimate kinase AroK [Gammaproteobacteria bacterium]
MKKPKNIFLIGPMGAGKTSIGRHIAKSLSMTFYDTDQVIEERSGADIPWIFDVEGAEGYSRREANVIAELTKLRDIVLATGGSAVALPENRAALAENGIVVYLETSLKDQLERTRRSKKRPLAKEHAVRQVALQNMRSEHNHLHEELADLVYNTDHNSVYFVAQDIIKKLRAENYL